MRNNKGFTLVELAVVLVIIGIILGAVIKGNDLIQNASQKAVLQIPAKWETPIWSYYDKKGTLPGATGGLITDFTTLKNALTTENITYPGSDAVAGVTVTSIASQTNACGVTGATRNAMVLGGVPLDYAKAMDRNIDGAEDGTKGRVRWCNGGAGGNAWATTDPVVVTYFFDKGL